MLAVGTAGYLFLHTIKNRKSVFLVLGIIVAATLFCGSRGAVVYVLASSLILAAAFLWGAPWRWAAGPSHGQSDAPRLHLVSAGPHRNSLDLPRRGCAPHSFLTLRLSIPNSSAYEVSDRTWDYPMAGLVSAIEQPHWLVGNGIGIVFARWVASMWRSSFISLEIPVWVEEGYGQMILEMGFSAPLLWILCTLALLVYSWRVVRRLRQTRFFPIAFAIFWYMFLLLYPFTYGGLAPYQNFVDNAYAWLIVGISSTRRRSTRKIRAVCRQSPQSVRRPDGPVRTRQSRFTWELFGTNSRSLITISFHTHQTLCLLILHTSASITSFFRPAREV